MAFVFDPATATKINKMKERVRWHDPMILERQIDQTRLAIADDRDDNPEFSFLVVGDSGSGPHRGQNPQRQIAEQMLAHRDSCRLILHTGDVVYLVGSSDYYPKNFIHPYREFLVGGEQPTAITYDQMVFNLPFLPVPGNHDYYDLPFIYSVLIQAALPFRRLLQSRLDLDIGWQGSGQGNVYARAFLDYLHALDAKHKLAPHLDQYYTTKTETGRCLTYQPGQFTRLPNRYYSFRYGGIDFFALDSNTFNAPIPLPATREGAASRRQLEQQRLQMEQQKREIAEQSTHLRADIPEEADQLDDLRSKLNQIEESEIDIEKQLAANSQTKIDDEQLEWLKQRLIESWHTEAVRGRIIYFHHPPYVTEASKWQQSQTLAVRDRLRQVLDEVAKAVGALTQDRPLVDLILNGHAHCLEYLRTADTGHADANLNWIVCGGSGHSLRRQRLEGPELREFSGNLQAERLVAKSQLFIGRKGQRSQKRRPYSFLRIDVKDGCPPKFVVRPYIAEWSQRQWSSYAIDPFEI